jgi:hypothetical protein
MALLAIPLRVEHLNELTPRVWRIVYEALFQTNLMLPIQPSDLQSAATAFPPGMTSTDVEEVDDLLLVRQILDILERKVIRMPLDHISTEGLVAGRQEDLRLLLDIFLELARTIAIRAREKRRLVAGVEAELKKNAHPVHSRGVTLDDDGQLVEVVTSRREETSTTARPFTADPLASSMRDRTPPPVISKRVATGSYSRLIDDLQNVESATAGVKSSAARLAAVSGKPAGSVSQLVDDIPSFVAANSTEDQRQQSPKRHHLGSGRQLSPKKQRPNSSKTTVAGTARPPTKELRFLDPKVDELQMATSTLEDRYRERAGAVSPIVEEIIFTERRVASSSHTGKPTMKSTSKKTTIDYRPRKIKLSQAGVRSQTKASTSAGTRPRSAVVASTSVHRVRPMAQVQTSAGLTLPAEEAAQAMRNVTRMIENTLPGVDIPDW